MGWVFAYLPLILIQEVLALVAAAEEKDRLADVLAVLRLLCAFCYEAAEWRHAGAGSDHYDWSCRVRRQLEVRVADMYRDVDPVVLVARTSNGVVEAVRVRVRVAVLLLLECEEVVRGHALYDVRCSRRVEGSHHGCDGDLVLLHH